MRALGDYRASAGNIMSSMNSRPKRTVVRAACHCLWRSERAEEQQETDREDDERHQRAGVQQATV